MYIPSHFRNENREELLAFMRAHPLALVASNGKGVPSATHLPFIIREEGEKLKLLSHFAYGNPHAHELRNGDEALVVFSGPNAYVSPALYDKKENVPTWNYVAVHASGPVRLDTSDEAKERMLQEMIHGFDPVYRAQWEALPAEYVSRLMKGIVALEVEVVKLEGKFKLSQNKTPAERERIRVSLEKTGLPHWMDGDNQR